MKAPKVSVVVQSYEAGKVVRHTLTFRLFGRLPFGLVRHTSRVVGDLPGRSPIDTARAALRGADAEFVDECPVEGGRELMNHLAKEAAARLEFVRLSDGDDWWAREEKAVREAAEKARREP